MQLSEIHGKTLMYVKSTVNKFLYKPYKAPSYSIMPSPECSFHLDILKQNSVSSHTLLLSLAKEIACGASKQLLPFKRPNHNYLGDDLDTDKLARINKVLQGVPSGRSTYDDAQLRELAFWRWVAFEGYAGNDPRAFPWLQCIHMLEHFFKTGWTLDELRDASIVEIGCGPLGMIEYLPGKRKVGYDPLNMEYEKLFNRARTGGVEYIADLEHLCQTGKNSFDMAICFNVLDHTTQPRQLLHNFMSLLRDEGQFLFQVNTVKEGETRPEDHARMHPSPMSIKKISNWLDEYSRDYQTLYSDKPTELNEYSFMAWGRKNNELATCNV
ncbi:MAG: class I SAM-dependent methyltransferase [Thermoguttaceae bacterium]